MWKWVVEKVWIFTARESNTFTIYPTIRAELTVCSVHVHAVYDQYPCNCPDEVQPIPFNRQHLTTGRIQPQG